MARCWQDLEGKYAHNELISPGPTSSVLTTAPLVCVRRSLAPRSSQAPCTKRHSTLRLPRLHAQPDAVNRGHADERARLPAVGRVRANGMREAVHDAVRRGAIEDERVARLDAHCLVPHVEVNGEAKGEEDDPVAQRVDMVR